MTAVLENVSLNEEGFMTDPSEWTEEIAQVIAKGEGIDPLRAPDHDELAGESDRRDLR